VINFVIGIGGSCFFRRSVCISLWETYVWDTIRLLCVWCCVSFVFCGVVCCLDCGVFIFVTCLSCLVLCVVCRVSCLLRCMSYGVVNVVC